MGGVPSVQAESERARLAPAFNLAGFSRGAKKESISCMSVMAELDVRSRGGGASEKWIEDGAAAGTCSDEDIPSPAETSSSSSTTLGHAGMQTLADTPAARLSVCWVTGT